MDYRDINKKNRDYMRGSLQHDYEMQWEDPAFMGLLLGHFPAVRVTPYDGPIAGEIGQLKSILKSYSYSNDNTILHRYEEKVCGAIEKIQEKEERWYGLHKADVRFFLSIQPFCLIEGYGGIGKSFFIYQFEKQLEIETIPHLCIYGKHQKTIQDIDFDSLIQEGNKPFVFIIDAINELDYSVQDDLIEKLSELKSRKGIRVIATYRTGRLRQDTELMLKSMASYCYTFGGVSYESALSELQKQSVRDVYKYEDILFTNNPFYLQALCKALKHRAIESERVNGYSAITLILENYIKTTLGKEDWEITKTVFEWMYRNRTRRISLSEIKGVVVDAEKYVLRMEEYQFLEHYTLEDQVYYVSKVETLTDFLLARYFVKEIYGQTEESQLSIIKQRREDFPQMDEVFIISLFDVIADCKTVGVLMRKSGLIESFRLDYLCHIRFSEEQIRAFQEEFHIENNAKVILHIGGYSNKPYNCQNFLNEYYFSDPGKQRFELSDALSGQFVQGRVRDRLKNLLYYVSVSGLVYSDEIFWFSLWCTASPNQEVRCLATKLLYETVRLNPTYINLLLDSWESIYDYYIQDAIIHVLALLKPALNDAGVDELLLSKLRDPEFYLAKSLKRIGRAHEMPYAYIKYQKRNLLQENYDSEIDDDLQSLFMRLDIFEKYLLPFRYWGEGRVDGITQFLAADSAEVEKWNCSLEEKFSCVKDSNCSGDYSLQRYIVSNYPPFFQLDCIPVEQQLYSFGFCIRDTMQEYGIDVFDEKISSEHSFLNSVFRKVIDIAVDKFYGSMMCNYYTDTFALYNNNQNSIGYEVYDPIEFDDEEDNLASPVPTYSSKIWQLGSMLLSQIQEEDSYDETWSKNAERSIEIIKLLLNPITCRGKQWVLLNASIRLSKDDHTETYDIRCCTKGDEHLEGVYEDRYLTIELNDWTDPIECYHNCLDRPWLCKTIPAIKGNKGWFDDTNLAFPPAEMISELNLNYSIPRMAWTDSTGEEAILCDNNKSDYFKNAISQAVFVRKDIFDSLVVTTPIHYFCFTEKMLEGKGFTEEASIHLEIANGKVINKFFNSEEQRRRSISEKYCDSCPHGMVAHNADQTNLMEEYSKMIRELGYGD